MAKINFDVYRNKAMGAFYGLAVGDALGVKSEGLNYLQIKDKWGFIDDFLDENPSGSDDTEFAVFNTLLLKKYGLNITTKDFYNEWKEQISNITIPLKGAGFSELMTVENIRNNIFPPTSGMHLHGWSDGLAMRVVPFGIVACGDNEIAKNLTIKDGLVSHSSEGINGGIAVSIAISSGFLSNKIEDIFELVLSSIEHDSWTYRAISSAIEIGGKSQSMDECIKRLNEELVCSYYYWSDLAPEAVSLSFGILSFTKGNFIDSVLGGVNIGRDTDTIAAICGAISGAINGYNSIPEKWRSKIIDVKGTCIKSLKDTKLNYCVDELIKIRNNHESE